MEKGNLSKNQVKSGDGKDNEFKILVASDNHLGYKESDPIIGADSFTTMEEIFEIGRRENVDIILLGGDVFHDNHPNVDVVNKTVQLFAQKVLGNDRPVFVEYKSKENLCLFGQVNYINPDMNISFPVFSISGNHDIRYGGSALDILTNMNFLNEFGTFGDDNRIMPVCLQKGSTRVALYGIEYTRDIILRDKLTKKGPDGSSELNFEKPEEDDELYFKILILHQNRYKRGDTPYIPEKLLPKEMDLVLWGHEHGSIIPSKLLHEPVAKSKRKPLIMQPGSSVATSLHKSESHDKQVAIVTIVGKQYQIHPIKLATIRPMKIVDLKMSELSLTSMTIPGKEKQLEQAVKNAVNDVLNQSSSNQNEKLPLVRVRLLDDVGDRLNFAKLNLRIWMHFEKKVANKNILLLKKISNGAEIEQEFDAGDEGSSISLSRTEGESGDYSDSEERNSIMSEFKAECQSMHFEALQPKDIEKAIANFVENPNEKKFKKKLSSHIKDVQQKYYDKLSAILEKNPNFDLELLETIDESEWMAFVEKSCEEKADKSANVTAQQSKPQTLPTASTSAAANKKALKKRERKLKW